jgi:hypothetical protein
VFLGPFGLAITLANAVEPHKYSAGDLRNEPMFWALVVLVTLVFLGTLMVLAVGRLRQKADGAAGGAEEPIRDLPER